MSAAQPGAADIRPDSQRPHAAPSHFLYWINPLAKIAGPLPAMIVAVLAQDLETPTLLILIAAVTLLLGLRWQWLTLLSLTLALPLFLLVFSVSFAAWTNPALTVGSPLVLAFGPFQLTEVAAHTGMATALRLAAIFGLAMILGLSSSGADLIRASIQQLRVPYRIGYTALAAFRFVPRFGHELEIIRGAHRVRGMHPGRGPVASTRRALGYVIPLLAGAIRHAERVSRAMESRAFGASDTRTERHLVPFRARDWSFMLGYWVLTAAVVIVVRTA